MSLIESAWMTDEDVSEHNKRHKLCMKEEMKPTMCSQSILFKVFFKKILQIKWITWIKKIIRRLIDRGEGLMNTFYDKFLKNYKKYMFFYMKIAVADEEINKEKLRVRTLVINFAHKKSWKFLTQSSKKIGIFSCDMQRHICYFFMIKFFTW